MNRLILSQCVWDALRKHLLSDSYEHLAFILAEYVKLGKNYILLGRELLLVPDEDLEGEKAWDGLSLKLEALLKVMNRANQLKCTIVEAHSHPFSNDHVDFSFVDLRGQKEIVSYLEDVSPIECYTALVLGRNSVRGQSWLPGKSKPIELDEVRVAGAGLSRFCAKETSGRRNSMPAPNATIQETYHRQVLALGVSGQLEVQKTRVGIVGLGGVGSIVAQQLAYLGTTDFVLIDDDMVQATNLHRLVTATKNDVGCPKVEVARSYIKRVNPLTAIEIFCMNARNPKAQEALQGCDLIFGCLDTDSGRLILNELCNAYLIPYIDCGVGINLQEGKIAEAGGRVIVWVPDRPCLLCSKEINVRIAAEELESPQERQFRKQHGYVAGASLPEPAVISLNGTVASIAVTEFLAMVTDFRASLHYTYYDMLEQRVGQRTVSKENQCAACALQGLGNRANLLRYARVGLPDDLPKV